MFYTAFDITPAGLFLEWPQGATLWHASAQQSPLTMALLQHKLMTWAAR